MYKGLSETWLTVNISDKVLYIPGYHLIRLDCNWLNLQSQTKKGSGLCCYINSNLKFSSTDSAHLNCSTQNAEILHVVIEQPHIKKCILINVYPASQGNIENFNDKIIDNITYINNTYPNAEMIMLVDFNLNIRDTNSEEFRQVKWIEHQLALNNILKEFFKKNPVLI